MSWYMLLVMENLLLIIKITMIHFLLQIKMFPYQSMHRKWVYRQFSVLYLLHYRNEQAIFVFIAMLDNVRKQSYQIV